MPIASTPRSIGIAKGIPSSVVNEERFVLKTSTSQIAGGEQGHDLDDGDPHGLAPEPRRATALLAADDERERTATDARMTIHVANGVRLAFTRS